MRDIDPQTRLLLAVTVILVSAIAGIAKFQWDAIAALQQSQTVQFEKISREQTEQLDKLADRQGKQLDLIRVDQIGINARQDATLERISEKLNDTATAVKLVTQTVQQIDEHGTRRGTRDREEIRRELQEGRRK